MITENFIKQCEKAEEIQEKWHSPSNAKIGDRYWRGGKDDLMTPEMCEIVEYSTFQPFPRCTYLPTQEQLQEMWREVYNEVPGSLAFKNGWIGIFINWVKSLSEFTLVDFNELWLAFVMKEKYHKLWSMTGERWVKMEGGKNEITL